MPSLQPPNGSHSRAFFALSTQHVLKQLGGSPQDGLSHQEAERRLEIHGWSQLRTKKPSFIFELHFFKTRPWSIILPFALIPMLVTETRNAVQRAWRGRTQD
ncbi:MAG: cation-transporting P-type ATPase [Candidatus Bipolaricaulota bacterium]